MGADEEDLERLAGSVSDGAAVDWKEAEASAAGGRERALLSNLRVISEIARYHGVRPVAGEFLASSSRLSTVSAPAPGAAAERSAESSPSRWGHLEIRALLGEGTYGLVYRAWDANLDREVALKLLRPMESAGRDPTSSVIREGRLLARVRHPHVVTVHGAERHDGRVGIWMELIQGRTLEDLLKSQGAFGAREAALIGVSLSSALAEVHRAGLVHRDIKGHNVIREQGGRIVLMDFSAGGEARGEEAGSGITGTPLCMAPDIVRGGEATARSDIYSLGVLLYHLVSGGYPVEARSWSELRAVHERRGARLLRDARPGLPEPFVRVVERCLAPDPGERFASAGELEQTLARAIGTEPGHPVQPVGETRKNGFRFHLKWGTVEITVGVGLAVALVAAVLLWLPRARPGIPPREGSEAHPPPPASSVAPGAPERNAAVPYDVEATLYRRAGGRDERLVPGARVRPGDELFLEFRASESLHVYVLNEDENGETYVLFPLAEGGLVNPLPPDGLHRLPGPKPGAPGGAAPAAQILWKVTSPGRVEHILVVASPGPLTELENDLRPVARAAPGTEVRYARLSAGAALQLRGIGGVVERPDPEPADRPWRLFEHARRLASGPERTRGVWIRQIDLENPVP